MLSLQWATRSSCPRSSAWFPTSSQGCDQVQQRVDSLSPRLQVQSLTNGLGGPVCSCILIPGGRLRAGGKVTAARRWPSSRGGCVWGESIHTGVRRLGWSPQWAKFSCESWASLDLHFHVHPHGCSKGHCSGFNSTHYPQFTSSLNLGILFGTRIFADIIKVRTEMRSCCQGGLKSNDRREDRRKEEGHTAFLE